ncbi:hypothetical protein PM082_016800 [Marasmius tenuissimus]|nr:hypothetical protein PM082_016800 [Marasmius tenuissimus]
MNRKTYCSAFDQSYRISDYHSDTPKLSQADDDDDDTRENITRASRRRRTTPKTSITSLSPETPEQILLLLDPLDAGDLSQASHYFYNIIRFSCPSDPYNKPLRKRRKSFLLQV